MKLIISSCWDLVGEEGRKKIQEDNDNDVQMKHETKLVHVNRWSKKSG